VLVGFAVETRELVAYAREKLARKRCDLVVANLASDGFEGDDNVATLVSADAVEPLGRMSKRALAGRILDAVRARQAAVDDPARTL
jgi:phosphopantothenoylcysteine decarboxylase/phosphopantothenate--cysteine ligase